MLASKRSTTGTGNNPGSAITGGGTGDGTGNAIASLLARIRAHRRYPELARRQGIEGTVGLRFHVRPDGSAEIEVVRSADPSLDEAAREAVIAAAPLPRLQGPQEIDLDFRLTDE